MAKRHTTPHSHTHRHTFNLAYTLRCTVCQLAKRQQESETVHFCKWFCASLEKLLIYAKTRMQVISGWIDRQVGACDKFVPSFMHMHDSGYLSTWKSPSKIESIRDCRSGDNQFLLRTSRLDRHIKAKCALRRRSNCNPIIAILIAIIKLFSKYLFVIYNHWDL